MKRIVAGEALMGLTLSTPTQRHSARLLVCELAKDVTEAGLLLLALGLIEEED